jgi:hypothetical protein
VRQKAGEGGGYEVGARMEEGQGQRRGLARRSGDLHWPVADGRRRAAHMRVAWHRAREGGIADPWAWATVMGGAVKMI